MECGNIQNDNLNNPVNFGGGGGGTGTVTSVALSAPAALFVSPVTGSPVTTTGTLALALASQSANLVFASPDGSAGTPTFRSLVVDDISDFPVQTGNPGEYLQTDGSTLSWQPITTSPIGTDKQVTFNDGGTMAGATLLWDKTTKFLSLTDATAAVGTDLYIAGSAGDGTDRNGGNLNFKSGSSTGNNGSLIKLWTPARNQGAGTTVRSSIAVAELASYVSTNTYVHLGVGIEAQYTNIIGTVTQTKNIIFFPGRFDAGIVMDQSISNVGAGSLYLTAASSVSGLADAPGGNVYISGGDTTGNGRTTISFLTTAGGQGSASTARPATVTARFLSYYMNGILPMLAFGTDADYTTTPESYTNATYQGQIIYAHGNDTFNIVQDRSKSAASYDFTLQAGGALAGGTNYTGGSLVLKSGIGTGNAGAAIHFYSTPINQGSGTSDRTSQYATASIFQTGGAGSCTLLLGSKDLLGTPLITSYGQATNAAIIFGTAGLIMPITTTTATAGLNITVKGGAPLAGNSNLAGGNIIIQGGDSTGNGGSYIQIAATARNLGSGTTARTASLNSTYYNYYDSGSTYTYTIMAMGAIADYTTSPISGAFSYVGHAITAPGNKTFFIIQDRNAVASGAGAIMYLQAGGCKPAGTNLAGGELRLNSGISTGSGTSFISFYLPYLASPAATTDNPPYYAAKLQRGDNSYKHVVFTLGDEQVTMANMTGVVGNILHFSNGFDCAISLGQINGTGLSSSKNFWLFPSRVSGTNVNGSTLTIGDVVGSASARTTGSGFRETRITRESRTSSGTTANDTLLAIIVPSEVNLTNNTTTGIFEINMPAGSMAGGFIDYHVCITDGTDYTVESGIMNFAVVNKAGTYTAVLTKANVTSVESAAAPTLSIVFSKTDGTNKVTINVNSNTTGITPTSTKFYYTVHFGSKQNVTQL
jgi:hypothetical protein